jgi:hypothetical protein
MTAFIKRTVQFSVPPVIALNWQHFAIQHRVISIDYGLRPANH